MSAKDYTLLGRLGFADADKKSGVHDKACRYLTQEHIRAKIFSFVDPDLTLKETSASTEVPISKGQAQYKQTIGFVDVCLSTEGLKGKGGPPPAEVQKLSRVRISLCSLDFLTLSVVGLRT